LSRFLVGCTVSALLSAGCGNKAIDDHFVAVSEPSVALAHVSVIDGSGGPAAADQTVLIKDGRIAALGPANRVQAPSGVRVLDLTGHTVTPGLVGVHNHLFYELGEPGAAPASLASQTAFARLYLAAGVTTIRTAGTVDFDGDARLKQRIDDGREPGPRIHLSSPYLGARGATPDPDAVARQVGEWADQGATSIKAYTTVRAAELKAAIAAAHARGLRVTGHLCSVSFREAAAMGIDNIEHGIVFDGGLAAGKVADECPGQNASFGKALAVGPDHAVVQQIIRSLVSNGVVLTSTLAVIESFTGRDVVFDRRIPDLLAPRLRNTYAAASAERSKRDTAAARMWSGVLAREMAFERAFAAAGGTLAAGVDPTGWGGVVAGIGDHRQLELLVEAGFNVEKAVRIATSNGAALLREQARIGTIEAGKLADLLVVRGDLAASVSAVRNVHLVFKNGIGYNPEALMASAQGRVGERQWGQFVRWPYNAILAVLVMLLVGRLTFRQRARPAPPSSAAAGAAA
jgi:imidazolonepropionase-like amidohydrolase